MKEGTAVTVLKATRRIRFEETVNRRLSFPNRITGVGFYNTGDRLKYREKSGEFRGGPMNSAHAETETLATNNAEKSNAYALRRQKKSCIFLLLSGAKTMVNARME